MFLDLIMFLENQKRFAKFNDKIIYLKIPLYEKCPDPFVYEWYSRNFLAEGVKKANKDDIIILSDVDEIPHPDLIAGIEKLDAIAKLQLYTFYYYLNLLTDDLHNGCNIFKKYWLNTFTMQEIVFDHSGWHFSYLGGAEQIKTKIKSYSHKEYNKKEFLDKVEENIKNQKDLFNRDIEFQRVRLEGEKFPKWLIENKDTYKHLILNTID